MAKKINHVKPSFIEGGEVWHDIDKFALDVCNRFSSMQESGRIK